MRFWGIIIFILLTDQGSKYIVETYMEVGQSVSVISNILNFTYVLNPGAAFGFFAYQTNLFIIITLLVIFFIVYYHYTLPAYFSVMRVGLALQLGGASGNLTDRIRTGYVVDFFDVSFFPPVFNIADVAIIAGIFFFAYSLLGEGRHLLTDEQTHTGFFSVRRFKRSPVGYNTEETDNFLEKIKENSDVYIQANRQLREQMHNLYKETKELKKNLKNKDDIIRAARENLIRTKEKMQKETNREKDEIKNTIEQIQKKNESLKLDNKKLKAQKELLKLNKENYNKIMSMTKEASSVTLFLASAIAENAQKQSEVIKKEAAGLRLDASQLKEKSVAAYREALRENEKLNEQLYLACAKLHEYRENEHIIAGAVSLSEDVCERINRKAQKEAEMIRREALSDALLIINDAVCRAENIFPGPDDDYELMYREILIQNSILSKILTEKMALLEKEELLHKDNM